METELTKLLRIEYPIMCAGMGYSVTTPDLAAAVSNAGGIGTLAFIGFKPNAMRDSIRQLKSMLRPGASYGVDLVFPADPDKHPGARKVNKAYLTNDLNEVVSILITERVPLLVCAIGVPEKWVTDALHANGTVIMNMIGHPKHVQKAFDAGVDILCCQGSEGGGHTGSVASTVLIPVCVDQVRGKKNFLGSPVIVVAAGGFYDGRGLAAALSYGAAGVWMGTRFLMTHESNAEKAYKDALLSSDVGSTVRSTVYSGRPMRVLRNKYLNSWEGRQIEQDDLIRKGLAPAKYDVSRGILKAEHMRCMVGNGSEYPRKNNSDAEKNFDPSYSPMLTGEVAGAIDKLEHAGDLVERLCRLRVNYSLTGKYSMMYSTVRIPEEMVYSNLNNSKR